MFLTRRLGILVQRNIKNFSTEAENVAGSDYFKKIISETSSKTYSQEKPDMEIKAQNYAKKFLKRQNKFQKKPKQDLLVESQVKFETRKERVTSPQNEIAVKEIRREETKQIEILDQEKYLDDEEENLTEEQLMEREIKNLEPLVRPVVYNLAYYVNKNPVIRTLVEMGVFIRKWDQDPSIAKFILTLDLEKEVKPRLIFLHDIGIPAENHAFIITKNPLIFKENIHDLNARIDYLKSKKFSDESIKKIIIQAPKWLSLSVHEVDSRLGWFQKEFNLTGNELRSIVTEKPKLVTLPLKVAHKVKFGLTDFLSYSPESLKNLLLKYPKLFTKDFENLESNFIFLTQVVKLTHEDIEQYPAILVCPLQTLKSRYAFLKSLDRIQFDPTKPNFISLKALCEPDEKVFCNKTARSSVDEFKKFLKTL
ncbi:unnamed protein product [Brachionus calyciflorus]|uniref:Transcription termination factor 3, mitochondrial n=1 Tax=Brachionus calyciflorus TaxID=104777 RepID=A0A813QLI9_9BILA|nr:unnamed protein product [Brachionus calyciflorus]